MIQAQMADGTVLQFPEGTPDAVVDKAASDYIGSSKTPGPLMSDYHEAGTDNTDIEPRDGIATRIVNATTEGFRTGAAGRTDPEAVAGREQFNRGNPINTWVVSPGLNLAGGVLGAAGGAIGQGAYELGNLYSPELGRDAYMGAQVLGALWPLRAKIPSPAEMTAAPRINPNMKGFEQQTATPRFVPERFAPDVSELDPRNAIQTLIQHDITENPPPAPNRGAPNQGAASQPPPIPEVAPRAAPLMEGFNKAEPPPVPPVEPPVPGSVGAAASREGTDPSVLTAKTPAQERTDFTTSVQQTVRDRARPGVKPDTIEDHNTYVPGVKRLESARVFDPEVAGNHDALMDIDPAYKAAVDKYEQENIHDVLKSKYQQMEGTQNTTEAIKEQRKAVSPDALGVFENERPVNGQPIIDLINEIRDGPTGKSEAVTNTLNRIEKSLYDKSGNLEVLPSQYYGARRNLMEIRDSGPMTKEGAEARTARRELGRVGEVLDRVIGEGSTGYKDVYLPQWAHFSRLIDQQEYLQSKTLGAGKITGQNGNITWSGMQKLLEQIAIDKKKPGNSRAKTLTEDQLNDMVAIRNELAALKHRDDLAKSNGSPTVKKAAAAARLGAPVMGLSPEAIDAVIHSVLAKTTFGSGNMVYQFVGKPFLEKRRQRKADAIMETTRNKLLNTDIPLE